MRSILTSTCFILAMVNQGFGGTITYELVGQVVGDYEATGTVTTDGTFGSITAGNLISTDVVVSTPAGSVPLELISQFGGVTATSDGLVYGGIPLADAVIFHSDPVDVVWALKEELAGERAIFVGTDTPEVAISLPHLFAVATVPEPASQSAAIVSGLLVLGIARRRRSKS